MQCLFLRSFDQYLDVIDGAQTAAAKEIEVSVVVPPGTVLLHHYEISHRASGRTDDSQPFRCMFKLQFTRCSEPIAPSWAAAAHCPNPFRGAGAAAGLPHSAAMAATWDWLSGCWGAAQPGPAASDTAVAQLLATMATAPTEAARVTAAYGLGDAARAGSGAALAGLLDALQEVRFSFLTPIHCPRFGWSVCMRWGFRGVEQSTLLGPGGATNSNSIGLSPPGLQAVPTGLVIDAPYQAGAAAVLPRLAMRGLAASGGGAASALIELLRHDDPAVQVFDEPQLHLHLLG